LILVTIGDAHPLSWAAEYGSLTVTEVLLKRGANVNAIDYEGIAPLNWLVEAGDPTIKTLPATEAILRDRGAKLSDYGASRAHGSGV
jgi:FOG: Ankyrin repeat